MRRFLAFAAKAAISALLLYLALDFVNLATLRERFSQIEIGWVAAGFLAFAAQIYLVTIRWWTIANACGGAVRYPPVALFMLIGLFFNQTLPSTVGGDAARMWLLTRHTGEWKSAVYSVLIDRIVGLGWLMLLVLACLPWSLDLIQNPVGRGALVIIGLCGVAGLAMLYLLTRLGPMLLNRWRLTRYLAELADASWSTIATLRVGSATAALSVGVHLLSAVSAWWFAKSIGSPFGLLQALLLVLPVMVIAAIPISIAGWGVREGAMVAAFAYAGLPEGDGLMVSLLIGGAQFLIGAIGGLVWILSGHRERIRPVDETGTPPAA